MTRVNPAPERLEAFYEEGYRPLVRVLTLACGSREDAEEVAEEAFTRLLLHWSRVSEYDDPLAWVRMVAFRLVADRRRRLQRLARKWISPFNGATVDRDGSLDVERAVAALPLTQRQVVLLHYVYDCRVEDIARTLGVRVGTVKSRLGRARSALAEMLREEVPT